jgi:hypothetical protein
MLSLGRYRHKEGVKVKVHWRTWGIWLYSFEGTVAWEGFLSIRSCIEWWCRIWLFWFWSKILRDKLIFMSIGIFSIYGKIFLAYSPNTYRYRLKYFWRIRRRLFINKTTLKLPLSPCTLIVIWRHYRIRLNTFGVFSDNNKALLAYSRNMLKELRIRWNKFALLIMPGNFKGKVFTKIAWDILYWPRTTKKFYFSAKLKKILLSAYMENTLNGEKSVKIKHISV